MKFFRLQIRGCCSWLVRPLLIWACYRCATQGMRVPRRCLRGGSCHGWMLRELRDISTMEAPQTPADPQLRVARWGLLPPAAEREMSPPENAQDSMT